MNRPLHGHGACKFCDAPLNAHESVKGICSSPKCQMKRVQQASRAVFQRDWQTYVGKQRSAVEKAAPELGAAVERLGGLDGVAIGVVPYQARPMVPLPGDRRTAFAANLDEIIAKAMAEGPPDPDLLETDRGEAPEAPLIDATCATCQGKCCILGGASHAFLTANNIHRFRLRNPGKSAEDAKQYYLDKIPEVSVEHSCVYHGPQGCVLTRADRADICNSYHCNPQTQLLKRLREMEADRAIIVANEGDTGPAVATYTAAAGWQPVPPSPDNAPDLVAVDAALAQIPPDLPQGGAGRQVPSCDFCGQPIDPHQAMTTKCCGRDTCEKRRMEEIGARVERQKHERYVAKQTKVIAACEDSLEKAAVDLGTNRAKLVIGVVPHQAKPVEPLPADRRAAFEAYITKLAHDAFQIPDPENYHSVENREMLDPAEEPIADACCATCQGSCCTLGAETHAFLDKYEVSRFRLTTEDPTPEKFIEHYMGKLPSASVRNACVYQTEVGCNLPRNERAAICNSFQCKGIKMLLDVYRDSGVDRAVVLAHKETEPRAVGLFDEADGWRPMIRYAGTET